MDNTISSLERQYCPPLDSSLLRAIVLDYDLPGEDTLADLRNTLDALRDSAQAEELTMNTRDDLESDSTSEKARSWPAYSGQSSADTEITNMTGTSAGTSTRFGGLHLQENTSGGEDAPLEPIDEWQYFSADQKAAILQDMFPTIKSFDIAYTLKSIGGDYSRAVEELLNQVFLEVDVDEYGDTTLKKGVDGFIEPLSGTRRKRKGKRIHRRTSSTPADERFPNSKPSPLSRWDRAKEDIDFISTRTRIQRPSIASLYHKEGASISATIAAICQLTDEEYSKVFAVAPEVLQVHADELAVDFPCLSSSQIEALVTITHPSTAAAHELARALLSSPHVSSTNRIIPTYRPHNVSPDTTSPSTSPSTLNFPSHTTDRLATTRVQAYNQANSAYRISRSKPLMGGAAAYYSSVARDASTAIRQHEAAEADSLVTGQSRPGQVDLHGVNARDAVRIAKQRVEQWWESQGREWAREGKVRGGGLVIITGRGQHSLGGKGKLGPAVGGMLVREGWKVEIGEGLIDVVGKVRR